MILGTEQAANEERNAQKKSEMYPDPEIKIGQRVEIKDTDMSGVVVGWDRACCEQEEWKKQNDVEALAKVR